MRDIKIAHHTVNEKRMFIIAEAGVNHDGNFDQALQLISLAKRAGADAIKFQAFTAEALCDRMLEEEKDVENLTGGSKSSYAMYKTLEFTDEQLRELKAYADREDIVFFASVFDLERAYLLHEMGMELFKISSGDITHFPLQRYVASFGKPVILSTGMATMVEVKNAVAVLEEAGCHDIIILHCTSDYPPRSDEINLNSIKSMSDLLDLPVGYSDHTQGIEVPFALAGMKVPVIEKHFTVDATLPGPDHKLSLDPYEFYAMVSGIRKIEAAMGSYEKQPTRRERTIVKTTRRGIKAGRDIQAGETLHCDDMRIIKPMTGLGPEFYELLDGKKVKRSIKVNEPIEKMDVEWN
ncbi:MAG: N-acetylneuraminate synthase family protein [Candidatus Omnitrophica bacterium]|nr:N-acetylneuraminate synthase family protein [Candidatus Omnitrophota bacterium]